MLDDAVFQRECEATAAGGSGGGGAASMRVLLYNHAYTRAFF